MSIVLTYALGTIAALVCTILCVILVTPVKKRDTLPKFFRFLHDIFNFRSLLIEKILKFFYVLSTLLTIFVGFFMLFSGYEKYSYNWYGGEYSTGFKSCAGYGILLMILGPIVIRLVYEGAMLAIIAVKNIIEINNKLKNQNEEIKNGFFSVTNENASYASTTAYVEPAPEEWVFCMNCGTRYDKSKGGCPNCGARQ